jgi:uncharacterized protein
MITEVQVISVVFVAVLTQALFGFGSAMIGMGMLSPILGLEATASLIALTAVTIEGALYLRLRDASNLRAISPLICGSLVAIPIAIMGVHFISQRISLALLGSVILGYAALTCLGHKVLYCRGAAAAYTAGLIAGALGGAYNISGPPVVLYAHSCGWPQQEVRSNLQLFFLVTDAFVVAAHGCAGNISAPILHLYLISLPVIAAALWLGLAISSQMSEGRFRQLSLALLALVGANLLLGLL